KEAIIPLLDKLVIVEWPPVHIFNNLSSPNPPSLFSGHNASIPAKIESPPQEKVMQVGKVKGKGKVGIRFVPPVTNKKLNLALAGLPTLERAPSKKGRRTKSVILDERTLSTGGLGSEELLEQIAVTAGYKLVINKLKKAAE
ncbi:MAG TPA: hypothetical protein VH234_01600, partial [Candidatus Saccharimonadales bacterium]|nr:hypothetical protein [Candidatus Saccharimonadales bacterium]